MKITYYILAAFLLSGCAASKIINQETRSIQEFETTIEKAIQEDALPGISIVVVKKDSLVYSKAFGYADAPKKRKASPQTAYQWWSVTKLFTATAILQLQEKGVLSLDDPVEKYLPYFQVEGTQEKISIKHLLTHSSGLGDIGMKILSWIHYEDDPAVNQSHLAKTHFPKYSKLKAQPEEKGNYSNLGYILLAAVIEAVSQQSYADYIQNNILEPLEMKSTGFDYSGVLTENIAAGSHPKDLMSLLAFTMIDKKRSIREKENGRFWFNPVFSDQQGSTGLIGSSEDLSHFMIAMLNGGSWKSKVILSPRSVELMNTAFIPVNKSPAPKIKDIQFGLSWFIHRDQDQRLALSHGGAGMAYVTHLRLFPEQELGIAIMTNSTYLGKDMGYSIINEIANLKW